MSENGTSSLDMAPTIEWYRANTDLSKIEPLRRGFSYPAFDMEHVNLDPHEIRGLLLSFPKNSLETGQS